MSRLRLVPPPQRQLTLDELTFVPRRPELRLVEVEEALPLARQLELMALEVGPATAEVAHRLVEILEGEQPHQPRRAA